MSTPSYQRGKSSRPGSLRPSAASLEGHPRRRPGPAVPLYVRLHAFRAPLAKVLARLRAGSGETVSVFNVVVDRESRQYFDVLFDKPVGQGRVGEVLGPAPAKIEPGLGGSWKWQTTNALRFQPSGGLPVASEYRVTLDPAKIVHERQVFSGDTELMVKTDKLRVEEVTVAEEPALEGKAKVVYRGGAQRLGLPKNPEVQPAELAKGRVGRHHRIATRQSEGGEIGVHPELG